ncbi:MAG: response regulator, partial [bacterium]
MKKIKAIIVDDERLARKELVSMLAEFPEIEISGEAANVESASKLIQELNPDVIFLDIQMPGESGFDLINKINIDAKIIFVTAYDEFALRAFEVNAVDYLLKPVNPKRLALSLERIQTGYTEEEGDFKKLNYDDRLLLHINNDLRFIKVDTIIAVFASGDYSEIHTSDG